MLQSLVGALAAVALLTGNALAGPGDEQKDKDRQQPAHATITKIDAQKGEICVQYTDNTGKSHQKTFHLAEDVCFLDETGKLVKLDVFESGNDVLVVESEGKLRELRRAPTHGQSRSLIDGVRMLIETTEFDPASQEELQQIYDMLRKLDTNKDGKIDPKAAKAEADSLLQERVKAVFERLDTNKDGKISKQEARGLIKEHFDRIDTNQDGFIAYEELLHAAKQRREQHSTGARQPASKPTAKERN
jgi:Ca2+-binding EF-hand superfamily protein